MRTTAQLGQRKTKSRVKKQSRDLVVSDKEIKRNKKIISKENKKPVKSVNRMAKNLRLLFNDNSVDTILQSI